MDDKWVSPRLPPKNMREVWIRTAGGSSIRGHYNYSKKEWYEHVSYNPVEVVGWREVEFAKSEACDLLEAENAQLRKEVGFMHSNCKWHSGDGCATLLGEKLAIIDENVKLKKRLAAAEAWARTLGEGEATLALELERVKSENERLGVGLASRFEKAMFEFMTFHRISKVWVTEEGTRSETTWSRTLVLHETEPHGEACREYDFQKLLDMSNEEFEALPGDPNKEVVRAWRKTMGVPSAKEVPPRTGFDSLSDLFPDDIQGA